MTNAISCVVLLCSMVSIFGFADDTDWAGIPPIIVTTTDDELSPDGDCSLREAVRAANLGITIDLCHGLPGLDVIRFDPALEPGVFTLTLIGPLEDDALTGDLDVTDDLIIIGNGTDKTILKGTRLDDSVPFDLNDRLIEIHEGVQASIFWLTLTEGNSRWAGLGGGALLNEGDTYMGGTIVSDSHAEIGGAILNFGKVTLHSVTVGGNVGFFDGGGIYNHDDADLYIMDSTFVQNAAGDCGGGISFGGCAIPPPIPGTGVLKSHNTTFTQNTSVIGGSAVKFTTGSAEILNATVWNNGTLVGSALSTTTLGMNVTVENSIVAGNFNIVFAPANCGHLISLGHNVLGPDCGFIAAASDQLVDPGLKAFVDSDKPGRGHFPLTASSPAIDTANPFNCPGKDQLKRPRLDGDGDGVARCDIGAVEFVPPTQCGIGFWKNHEQAWEMTGFSRNDPLASLFDVGAFASLGEETLHSALKFKGGPGQIGSARILLRKATASLLNSTLHPEPSVTTAEIISEVNAALSSGSRKSMLNLAAALEDDNEVPCIF